MLITSSNIYIMLYLDVCDNIKKWGDAMTISSKNVTIGEGYHLGPRSGVWNALGEMEGKFGMSIRRLYDQARRGHILGVVYDPRRKKWSISAQPGLEGAVPDKPQEYLLPVETRGIDWEICPGDVSGRCYCVNVRPELSHPTAWLVMETGYSGAIYRIIPKLNSDAPG
jgi:hypothetical protein